VINGTGDGNTAPDFLIDANGQFVKLRAERAGPGSDRIYTVTLSCGEVGSCHFTVTVPHDQGH
jgi:hypothetical protein